jgi:hypothetical protein
MSVVLTSHFTLAEYDEMKAHPEKYKQYHSFSDLVKDVGNEAGYHHIQPI